MTPSNPRTFKLINILDLKSIKLPMSMRVMEILPHRRNYFQKGILGARTNHRVFVCVELITKVCIFCGFLNRNNDIWKTEYPLPIWDGVFLTAKKRGYDFYFVLFRFIFCFHIVSRITQYNYLYNATILERMSKIWQYNIYTVYYTMSFE